MTDFFEKRGIQMIGDSINGPGFSWSQWKRLGENKMRAVVIYRKAGERSRVTVTEVRPCRACAPGEKCEFPVKLERSWRPRTRLGFRWAIYRADKLADNHNKVLRHAKRVGEEVG